MRDLIKEIKDYEKKGKWVRRVMLTERDRNENSRKYFFFSLNQFIFNLDSSTFMPNPFYWAGNEPDILAPFQFNHAGILKWIITYLQLLLK